MKIVPRTKSSKFTVLVFLSMVLFFSVIPVQTQDASPTPDEKKQAEQKAVIEARQGIASVQGALDNSSDVIRRMEASKNSIANLSDKPDPTELTLRKIDELSTILKRLSDANFNSDINGAAEKLATAKTSVTSLLTKFPEDSANEDVINARTAVNTRLTEIDNQSKSLAEGKTAFNGVVAALYELVKSAYGNNVARLKVLEDTASDATDEVLFDVLPEKFGYMADSIHFNVQLDTSWVQLAARIASFSGLTEAEAKARKDAVDNAAKELSNKATAITGKIKPWFTTVNSSADGIIDRFNRVLKEVYDNPDQAAGAELNVEKAGRMADYLRQMAEDWTKLRAAAKKAEILVSDRKEVEELVEKLDSQARRLETRKVLLMDSTAGDMSKFKTEFIQLYYFTDTNNLIRALNPAAFEVRDVAGLREQAAQLRRELDRAGITLSDAQGEVNVLQKRLEDLREEKRQADARLFSTSGLLSSAEKRLADLKARPDPQDAGKMKRAEDDVTARKAEKDAAQANSDAKNNEQTGLPGKITAARDRLISAQGDVRRARSNALLLANAESEAFAAARDNEKIFIAPILGTSRDPMKRVFLYAFGNRKVIYMRGLERDVNEVKAAIALFDRPAPQARLTLWTLELNSTADNKGAQKFATVLPEIENGLANSRSRIAASLSFLRDSILYEVNKRADEKLKELKTPPASNPGPITDRDIKWARAHFYEKSVLLKFGFDPDKASSITLSGIAEMMLPDPTSVTTLGEALLVISLAKHEYRREIFNAFQKHLNREFENLSLPQSVTEKYLQEIGRTEAQSRGCSIQTLNKECWFAATRLALGINRAYNGEYDYTSQQKEIVDAIIKSNTIRVNVRYRQLLQALKEARNRRVGPDPSPDELTIARQLTPILNWLSQQYGFSAAEIINSGKLSSSTFRDAAGTVDLLRTANAQVARADLMLKQMIDAVDQDIDRHFVQPTIEALRVKLVKEKVIGVGVANRTSMIASNRLQARVDARTTAALPLGEEVNLLQAAQQLTQVYLAAQTGGVLGAFGSLNSLPQKDAREIYGLTTQSQFKATPIFDPTGQTLRFQFDYVAANTVQEPDGTTNPQMPRVERHTVNTEVELNNLEIREISRYNTNAKLGLAVKKTGGIPLIKDIPGVSYVPLLGWFTRKSGSAAVVQQSLIFGQTTMYPTIGDMLELLRSSDYLDFVGPSPCTQCSDGGTKSTNENSRQKSEVEVVLNKDDEKLKNILQGKPQE